MGDVKADEMILEFYKHLNPLRDQNEKSPTRRRTTTRYPLRVGFLGITTTLNLSRSRAPGSGCVDFDVRKKNERSICRSLRLNSSTKVMRTASRVMWAFERDASVWLRVLSIPTILLG